MKAGSPRRLALVGAGLLAAGILVGVLVLRAGGGSGDGVEYGKIAFTVDNGSARCALLAETGEQRAQGLMERTDLGPYTGMIFSFPADTNSSFYMRNTPMPLSIAWFDAGGQFVSAHDMDPCPDRDGCPNYGAAGTYRYALEVPQGDLPSLGIGPGSRIRVGGNCP